MRRRVSVLAVALWESLFSLHGTGTVVTRISQMRSEGSER